MPMPVSSMRAASGGTGPRFHAPWITLLALTLMGGAPLRAAGGANAPAEPPPAAQPAPQKPATPAAPGPAAPAPGADAAEATERPITIREAIDIAFRNHADVAIASQGIVSARQRVTEAKTGTLPTVSGGVTFSGRGVSDLGGVFGAGPTSTRYDNGAQPAISARQTLFDTGLTRLQVRQARFGLTNAEAGLVNARRLLAFNVTSDYIQLLRNQKQFDLSKEQVRLAQQQLDLIDARIGAGAAAASDRFPVVRTLRLAQEQQIAAQNNVNVGASALRNTMGLPLGPPLGVADLPEPVYQIPTLQESLAEAIRLRPDLAQDVAFVESSTAAVSVARLRRRPLLTGSVGFNVTPNDAFSRSDWNFLTGVSMPIWDAGLTRAQERDAAATLDSNRARLEQTRKDVEAEVQQAHLNVASAKERVDASRASVEAARVALEAANARYQQGLAITVDLTDAQIGYITASNDAINALYDYYLARAQLARAVGTAP
jgi:outer membrane protein